MKVLLSLCLIGFGFFGYTQELRILPHITNPDGPFHTQFIFENLTDEAVPLEIQGFLADGTARPSQLELLQAGEIKTFDQDYFQGHFPDTHFFVGGPLAETLGIQASVAYSLKDGSGSPVIVKEVQQSARRWRLFAGNWDLVFDGLAIVNPGDQAISLTIRQIASDGTLLAELPISESLPGKAQTLFILGDPNTRRFDTNQSSIFEIVASEPCVVLALQGDIPGARYLWQNAVTPLD